MTQNSPSHKQDGVTRFMVIFAWVGGLAFLTWLFQGMLDERFNPNDDLAEDVPTRVVVLDRNRQGHYVASGLINRQRVTFLVDTGATDVALPEAVADRLGLERQGGGISHTAGGPVAVWHTVLDEVQLGGIKVRNVKASILPTMDQRTPVLLGMSFLKRLELLQRDGQLTLRQG